MKVLSNFDTHLAESLYTEYCELFGAEYVVLVTKSKLIRYATILPRLLGYMIVFCVGIYVVYMYPLPHPAIQRIFRAILILRGVMLLRTVSAKYMDFQMDFLIVTPKEVIKYDQHGVFSRVTEKIHADKLKTITVQKKGFFQSFFDIGSIVFLAEGDAGQGDIIMDSLDAVEATERQVRHILGQDVSGGKK